MRSNWVSAQSQLFAVMGSTGLQRTRNPREPAKVNLPSSLESLSSITVFYSLPVNDPSAHENKAYIEVGVIEPPNTESRENHNRRDIFCSSNTRRWGAVICFYRNKTL